MRLLLSPLLVLACALPLACGDDAVGTAATSSASASTTATTSTATASSGESSSTTAATGTASSTAPTSSPTTTDPTTSTTAVTDGTTESTTAGTTASTTAGTTAGTTDGTTAGTTDGTTAGTTDGTTDGTGGDDPFICADDKDCALVNDCCACDPVHVDEQVPECDIQCLQPTCDSVGLAKAKAVCRFGRCTFEKVTCNPLQVTCKALPPECPDFQVPSVDGDCWTGSCVLPEACDWVPSCDYCGAGMTCVTKLQKGAFTLCEPLPPACGDGPATCACADEICEASPPHIICQDLGESLGCECPNC